MILKCVVVDDEPLAAGVIAGHIKRTPFLELDRTFFQSVKAFEYLSENKTDLLFVDIQMPDLSGLDLVNKLVNKPVVIFTTAFHQYALEGFRADAVDYLLKPVDYPEFLKASEKAKKWVTAVQNTESVSAGSDFLFVRSEHKMIRIELNTIRYIEGMSEYVRIYRENAKPVMTLMSLNSLENSLPADCFMRIHKSYIINLRKISEVESNFIHCGENSKIPFSKLYKDRLMEYINLNFIT